ncbi:MAG TPA: hypothetical protein VJN71_04940 [Nitrososphaerales archaeon]|nr:hypothetical protein [Nitrososphaerales archaeon]
MKLIHLKPLTVTLLVILCLVSLSSFALPSVAASTTLKLTPTRGIIGTSVTMSGRGYTPNSKVKISGLFTNSCPTNSTGGFSCNVSVPNVGPGAYVVKASSSAGSTSAKFTVRSRAHVIVRPVSGAAGSTVKVTGTHFGLNIKLAVTFNGVTVVTTPTAVTTSSTGTFSLTFAVPNLPPNPYVVSVKDTLGYVVDTAYTIT